VRRELENSGLSINASFLEICRIDRGSLHHGYDNIVNPSRLDDSGRLPARRKATVHRSSIAGRASALALAR
jgi:hypothetical protein